MIESDSADALASIHTVEHVYVWEVEAMLTEWKRILKVGGKLIIELPSGNKVLAYLAHSVANKEPLMPFMSMHALYGDPQHQDELMTHHWLWFKEPLREILEKVGFRQIEFQEARYHFRFRDLRVECIK